MTTGTTGTLHAISRFDLTIFEDESIKDDLKSWCERFCKKWGFQGEKCPTTGKFHFQIRISLKKKARKPPFMDWPAKVSPTSNEITAETFYDYVTKEDSQVLGPFKDCDPKPAYIPRQIREVQELYPWQAKVLDLGEEWDTRHIDWIYCPDGNIGKSTLAGYVRAHALGRVLPMVNDYKELMEIVCDMPTARLYMLDLPRAIKKDKLHQLLSGIETIKDGYAFDRRYKFTEKIFDCPNIWLFSNTLPDFRLMSADRWRVWSVVGNNLLPYKDTLEIESDTDNEDSGSE